jgi:protein phosphatase
MVSCTHCASLSADPDFCEVCGADLAAGPAAQRLVRGDRLAFDSSDGRTQRAERVTITLTEPITEQASRRVWMASSTLQHHFRVEELDGGEERDPDRVPAFPELVELPLAVTTYNTRRVQIYTHTESQSLAERLQRLGRALSPAELVDWMTPVLDSVQTIHQAGFVSLRLCPHTIAYRADGSVWLQYTGGLYRADVLPARLSTIRGYTAPEIYTSDRARPPGTAADIFSLAMVAYFLVTRRDPPVGMHSSFMPALRVRDLEPTFPLEFARFFSAAACAEPDTRLGSIQELRSILLHCHGRTQAPSPLADTLLFSVASETHTGIYKRLHNPTNQDVVFSACRPDHQLALLAVADGISTASMGSGDIASGLAGRRIQEAWDELLENPHALEHKGAAHWLTRLLNNINGDIVDWLNERFAPFAGDPALTMGTTCVLLLAWRGSAHVVSVGDSRAYLIRDRFMERITRDHNLMTLGIARGLDADNALMMPERDALARCVGVFDLLPDGFLQAVPPEPDHYAFVLQTGDRVLLCSDGLTDFAGASEDASELAILNALQNEPQPEIALLDLVQLANKGGGGDNIGAALLAAEPTPLSLADWLTARRRQAALAALTDLLTRQDDTSADAIVPGYGEPP